MAKEYRSRNRILLDLLRAVKNEPGVATTRLLFLVNLSHDRLTEYVGEAVQRGWILESRDGERRNYNLADGGQRALGELDKIDRMMQDFGLGL